MSVPLLSELREPPVVGRFYMVPGVRLNYLGREDWWPTLGPLHSDNDFFSFPDRHYHVDARFLTSRQAAFLASKFSVWLRADGTPLESIVGAYPLARRRGELSAAPYLPKGLPELRRRRCSLSTYGHAYGEHPNVERLRAHYGEPAEPRRLADGRLLCPHRKADLSSFPPDSNGIVVCPLHGLRVRCSSPATDASPSASLAPASVGASSSALTTDRADMGESE